MLGTPPPDKKTATAGSPANTVKSPSTSRPPNHELLHSTSNSNGNNAHQHNPDENKSGRSKSKMATQGIDALAEVASSQHEANVTKVCIPGGGGHPGNSHARDGQKGRTSTTDVEDETIDVIPSPASTMHVRKLPLSSRKERNEVSGGKKMVKCLDSDEMKEQSKVQKNNERKYVVHNYIDHCKDEIQSEYERKVQKMSMVSSDRHKVLDLKFIIKLHIELENIEEDGKHNILGWMPHGRSFRIHDRERFIDEILPKYFGMQNGTTSCTSFMRQLHMYGFTRLTRVSGPDQGSYYNEYFLRGKAFLTCRIPRVKINGKGYKHAANPLQEPNFYRMAKCSNPVDFERNRSFMSVAQQTASSSHGVENISRSIKVAGSQILQVRPGMIQNNYTQSGSRINSAMMQQSRKQLDNRYYPEETVIKSRDLSAYGINSSNHPTIVNQRLFDLNNANIDQARDPRLFVGGREPMGRRGMHEMHALSSMDLRSHEHTLALANSERAPQIVYQPTLVYPDGNTVNLGAAGHTRPSGIAPTPFVGGREMRPASYLPHDPRGISGLDPVNYLAESRQSLLGGPAFAGPGSQRIGRALQPNILSRADQQYLAAGSSYRSNILLDRHAVMSNPSIPMSREQVATQRGHRWDNTQHRFNLHDPRDGSMR